MKKLDAILLGKALFCPSCRADLVALDERARSRRMKPGVKEALRILVMPFFVDYRYSADVYIDLAHPAAHVWTARAEGRPVYTWKEVQEDESNS